MASSKYFDISLPNAPAFIIRAPPTVPGTPIRLSNPPISAAIACFTIVPSMTPASTIIIEFCFILRFLKDFFKEITIPSNPLSHTNIFEPEPIKMADIFFSEAYVSNVDNSSRLSGKTIQAAGPPIPKVVCLAKGSSNVISDVSILRMSFFCFWFNFVLPHKSLHIDAKYCRRPWL